MGAGTGSHNAVAMILSSNGRTYFTNKNLPKPSNTGKKKKREFTRFSALFRCMLGNHKSPGCQTCPSRGIHVFRAVVAVHWFIASFYTESNEHMLASVTSVTNLSPERQPVKIHGCCVWSR